MKLMHMVITAAVVVILLGSFTMPVIADAQQDISPISEYNIGTGQTYREAKAGDVFELHSIYDSDTQTKTDTWTLNGKSVLNPGQGDISWNLGIISDAFWIKINSADSTAASWADLTASTPDMIYIGATSNSPDITWTITFDTNIVSWTYNGDTALPATKTMEYTWAFVPCSIDEGGYMSSTITSDTSSIIKNLDDVVMCGSYSTGDLDTNYYYYKGDTYVSNANYTGENSTELSLREGTFDLYDATVKFTVSDGSTVEEFSPYRALVPYEVIGHSSDSATVHMLGILPVLLICSFIALAAGIFIKSKY